ncbi:MAG: response regulator [Puniceicoccaceae bacterium]|nr:MAG: response regulator [Puniceicoccaceae bacterium]
MGQTDDVKVSGSELVLLAEDEAMIRELIQIFLHNLGYTVVEAVNGRDCLAKARKLRKKPIRLLITDLVMPEMGGIELAAAIRKEFPEIRILFVSGYTDDIVILEGQLNERTAFLRKPFNFDSLRAKLEELLAD